MTQEVLLSKSAKEWLTILDAADVPCAPILRRRDVINHPQIQANATIGEYKHQQAGILRQAAPAANFSETPAVITRGAPMLGEFSKEALIRLGYDEDTIESLIKDGIIATPQQLSKET